MRRLRRIQARVLPRGAADVGLQLGLFALAYVAYQLVRGLVATDGTRPFEDADRIIALERRLHVFVEPAIQAWTAHRHLLMTLAGWTYLNAQFLVTVGALVFIYLRRNDSFYFVRNMFLIAMAIALVGYTLFPTAPPRLMPQWGFTDPMADVAGVGTGAHGAGSVLVNFYAAVPSMHVCFSLMVGVPMARLLRQRTVRVLWALYPLLIVAVVVATGNHYFTDVALGALTAGAAALIADRLLARARPQAWAFTPATVMPS